MMYSTPTLLQELSKVRPLELGLQLHLRISLVGGIKLSDP